MDLLAVMPRVSGAGRNARTDVEEESGGIPVPDDEACILCSRDASEGVEGLIGEWENASVLGGR